MGYEQASERWSPVQTVETIMLSIISMLSSPNDESPANIDAAKQFREDFPGFRRRWRSACASPRRIRSEGFDDVEGAVDVEDASVAARLAIEREWAPKMDRGIDRVDARGRRLSTRRARRRPVELGAAPRRD